MPSLLTPCRNHAGLSKKGYRVDRILVFLIDLVDLMVDRTVVMEREEGRAA